MTTTLDDLLARGRGRRSLPAPAVRRLLRTEAGLRQHEIAGLLGVTREAVSRWESGNRTPRGRALDAYVELLDRLARA